MNLLLLLCLLFSKSNVDEQTTSTDMMSSATENNTERSETSIVLPIEAMTLEQLREELNLTLTFPMPAQNVHKLNGDPAIYEMDFTQGNYAFTFRFAKTDIHWKISLACTMTGRVPPKIH